ncbi:MAG: efflux RND transporter permease subunit [Cyclonatronaceae bacterium]
MTYLADFILNNRKIALAIFALMAVAAVFPVLRIQTNFDLEGFFPVSDPTIEEYRAFSEEFGRDDNVIIVGLASGMLFTEKGITGVREITALINDIDHVVDVTSITNAEYLVNRDGALELVPFFDSGNGNTDLRSVLDEFRSDPFSIGLLVNEAGDFTAIYLEIDEETNSFRVRGAVIQALESVLEPYRDQYDVYIAGIPYFRNQYVQLLNNEIIFYISISSVLIILLLWFLFRNIQGVVIPIAIVWLTILFTVAILELTGGYFEILTSSIAPILLCVGIADSVHMLVKYNDNRYWGLGRFHSIRDSLIVLGSATFITSVTTAIGFATLATSNVIPMRTFGIYTAAGVLIAYLITIFMVPGLLPYFKDRQHRGAPATRFNHLIENMLLAIFNFSKNNYRLVVTGTLLFTILMGLGVFKLKVNGKVFDDIGDDSFLVLETRFIGEQLSPLFPLEFVLDTGVENGIADPELLRRISDFEEFLLSYAEIERITSFNTLVGEVHRLMSGNEDGSYAYDDAVASPDMPETTENRVPEWSTNRDDRIPESRQLVQQYLLLLELTGSESVSAMADFTYSKARIATQVYDVGSWRINQIREEIRDYTDRHFSDITVKTTGTTILVADLTDNIVFSLSASIMLAFLIISLIMGYMFRNGKIVLISLLPNIMPLLVTAGFMGYFGVDIKPSTAVIFTIAFGIAVDDSIHFLARFRIESIKNKTLADSIRITTQKTGRAIILTSMILLVGFGTLGSSEFDSTMLMGQLVCLTIFVALLADLIFLPALIYWIHPKIDLPSSDETGEAISGHEVPAPNVAHQEF